jgi:hypothetical protein
VMFHPTGSAPACPGMFSTSGGEGRPDDLPYTAHDLFTHGVSCKMYLWGVALYQAIGFK